MVQTRAQKVRTRVALSGSRPPNFMRNGPSSLKPHSCRKKRTRKRKKEEVALWPLDELVTVQPRSSAAVKIATMSTSNAQETPITIQDKPTAGLNNGEMVTTTFLDTILKGPTQLTTSAAATPSLAQEPTTTPAWPSMPKEVIEQHTLRIMPRPGASLEEIDRTVRSRIESPCGNVVWSSSRVMKPKQQPTATATATATATLEMSFLYNDCGRHDAVPHACRMMQRFAGRLGSRLHEPLRLGDVVGVVGRGLPELVASCEVVAGRSWAVNAVSHGESGESPRGS